MFNISDLVAEMLLKVKLLLKRLDLIFSIHTAKQLSVELTLGVLQGRLQLKDKRLKKLNNFCPQQQDGAEAEGNHQTDVHTHTDL